MKSKNHKVLITGATSGIGLALTNRFFAEGNQVIAVGRNHQKLDQLKTSFKEQIDTYACDIANRESLHQLIQYIHTNHPDLSILVNNAGIQYNYEFAKEGNVEAKIDQEIEVNLTAPLLLIHYLAPILQSQNQAALVNVSSGLGFVPKQSAPVYCGTKAAVHIFSKALRYQLEKTNLKVFEIIPSLVDTPMTEGRGKGKITPEQLVDEFWRAFQRDRFEVNIGKVKLLRLIQRIVPRIADGMLKQAS